MRKILFFLSMISGVGCLWAYNINGVEMTAAPGRDGLMQASLRLTNGQSVTFSGFDDRNADEIVQPDFFDVTSADAAVFTGVDGDYMFYYTLGQKVLYVERTGVEYPEVLYIIGGGFGHPKAGAVHNGWSLDAPYATQAKKIGDQVYELTMYLDGNFDFLSKSHRDWDYWHNIAGADMRPFPEDMVGINFYVEADGTSHLCSDFMAGEKFEPGVYKVRFDVAAGKMVLTDCIDPDEVSVSYMINGKPLENIAVETANNGPVHFQHMYVDLDLEKGQTMDFSGFRYLEHMLQPEYFEGSDGKYVFKSPTGSYRIYFVPALKAIWCERTDRTTLADDVLFLTGANFRHPSRNLSDIIYNAWLTASWENKDANWGWTKPCDYVCCVTVAPGVYETYLTLLWDFMFRGFDSKGSWTSVIMPDADGIRYTTIGDNAAQFAGEWNFNRGSDSFVPGCYHIRIDTNDKTIRYTKVDDFNAVVTSADEICADNMDKTVVGVYTVSGMRVADDGNLARGIYIVRYSDGTSVKVVR